jgi:hypothetical protein
MGVALLLLLLCLLFGTGTLLSAPASIAPASPQLTYAGTEAASGGVLATPAAAAAACRAGAGARGREWPRLPVALAHRASIPSGDASVAAADPSNAACMVARATACACRGG